MINYFLSLQLVIIQRFLFTMLNNFDEVWYNIATFYA